MVNRAQTDSATGVTLDMSIQMCGNGQWGVVLTVEDDVRHVMTPQAAVKQAVELARLATIAGHASAVIKQLRAVHLSRPEILDLVHATFPVSQVGADMSLLAPLLQAEPVTRTNGQGALRIRYPGSDALIWPLSDVFRHVLSLMTGAFLIEGTIRYHATLRDLVRLDGNTIAAMLSEVAGLIDLQLPEAAEQSCSPPAPGES